MATTELSIFVLSSSHGVWPDVAGVLETILGHVTNFLLVLLSASLQSLAFALLSGVETYERSRYLFYLFWLPSFVYILGMVELLLLRVAAWTFAVLWGTVLRRTSLGWILEVAAAALLRWFWVPPPATRGELVDDACVAFSGRARAAGRLYASSVGVAFSSATSGGDTVVRLRKRARWVRKLEHVLGGRPGIIGKLMRGRWTPDLPNQRLPLSANVLLTLLDGEAKLLGGGVLPNASGQSYEPFLVVEFEGARRVLVPSLLAKLSTYVCFRPRTEELLSGLRVRAREWFSDKEVHDLAASVVLPDNVEIAFRVSAPERLSRERLDTYGVPPSA